MSEPNILVAGIGNIFLGDDGFGCEVTRRLAQRPWPTGVRVRDFGIRGFDLAYALLEPYDLAILVDAMPRGEPPGTVYVVAPELTDLGPDEADAPLDSHALQPLAVLRLVKSLGGEFGGILIVGCEPADFGPPNEGRMGLSTSVAEAVERAAARIVRLVEEETSAGRLNLENHVVAADDSAVNHPLVNR